MQITLTVTYHIRASVLNKLLLEVVERTPAGERLARTARHRVASSKRLRDAVLKNITRSARKTLSDTLPELVQKGWPDSDDVDDATTKIVDELARRYREPKHHRAR